MNDLLKWASDSQEDVLDAVNHLDSLAKTAPVSSRDALIVAYNLLDVRYRVEKLEERIARLEQRQ